MPEPISSGQEQPLVVTAPRLPSYAAFAAEAYFFGDFCVGLALPLAMMVSIARSLDPRVGPTWATGGAAPDTPPAGPQAKGPLWPTPAASGALEGFPYGFSLSLQVLHVARHPVWYVLLRPARQRDWAGLLLNGIHLLCPGLGLLLAVSSRTSAVWAWWKRYRLAFILVVSLLTRCVLLLAAFLLLPPHTWPSHTWAAYVVNAASSPQAHALAMGVYNLLVKVPHSAAAMQALAHAAAVFVLAYRVAPTIVTRWREQRSGAGLAYTATCGSDASGPVPLQCGSPLRPEHSALLSCRPLALQVLLGLAMVAWPVGLSWAVDGRLRRQHAAVCSEWVRQQRGRQQGQQGGALCAPASTQQHGLAPPCSVAKHLDSAHRGRMSGTASGSTCSAPGDTSSQKTPAEAQVADPGTASIAAARSARYRSRMAAAMAAAKVQEHPGDFEEFGGCLASVLQDCVRQELGTVATADVAPSQPSAIEPLLWTTVIRGCVQVVLWGWVPEGEGEGGAGAGGVGQQDLAEQLVRRLAARLDRMLAQEGAGSVRGVSVQVGHEVAVLGEPSPDVPLPGVLPLHGDRGGGGGSGTSVRLLQMSPPAVALAAAAATGTLTMSLLLHSPAPQPARVLVLAERQGDASSSSSSGEPPSGDLGLQQHLTPARPLLELPVQLVGGVQEVEVQLGAGQLAELCKAGEAADAAGMLRVAMVGPEHQPVSAAEQRAEAAEPRPLVHWVAPPLLLLPPAAAAEVCGAWEEMQHEAGGGLAEAEQEGQRQGHGQPSGEDGQAEAGGSPDTGVARLSIVSTNASQRSSLWWCHLAPLLGDLAYALGRHRGMGQEEAADPVWETLLPYLQEHGMAETLSLLASRRGEEQARQQQQLQQEQLGTGRSSSAVSLPTAHPGAATSDQPPARTTGTHGSSSSSHQRPPPDVTQPSAFTAAGVAAATTRGDITRTVTLPRPFLFLLPRPFSPPHLEAAYQAWRLEGLAANVAYVLGAGALVYLSMLLRLSTLWATHGGDGGSSLPGAVAWAQLARATLVATLNTIANGLALVVLQVLVVIRSRGVQKQQLLAERQQGVGRPAAAAGSTMGLGAGAREAVLQPNDIWVYRLAACVAGPAVLLLSSVLVVTTATPLDTQMVGNTRTVHAVCLLRAVVVPCLQQMSTWEAVAAAPLLGPAETLMLLSVQPGWGVWRGAAVAAACRLGAAGVSAAWERRSRRRFVRMQRGSRSEGSERPRTGAVSLGAKVKAA